MLHARLIILEGPSREVSDKEVEVGMTFFLEHTTSRSDS